jgi:hypothetical protein
MKHYLTGTKADVIRRMADYAIRDQQALIYALTPSFNRDPDEVTAFAIKDAKECILDFKRISKEFNKS